MMINPFINAAIFPFMPRGEKRGGGRRAPPDDAVREALLKVMREAKHIRSQRRLLSMVDEELKKMDRDWGITAKRLRRLAAETPGVKIISHCRVSHGEGSNICPVCGKEMRPIKNETLYGWLVTSGYSCPRCGYWTGRRKRVPTLYEFILEED